MINIDLSICSYSNHKFKRIFKINYIIRKFYDFSFLFFAKKYSSGLNFFTFKHVIDK